LRIPSERPLKPLSLAGLLALAATAARALPDPRFEGPGAPALPVAAAPAANAEAVDERLWVELAAPDKAARQAAVDAGVSIEAVAPGKAAGFAGPAALERVRARGLTVLSKVSLRERFGALEFPERDSIYHDYAETVAELRSIASSAPDLASVFPIGKSVRGRDILALRLNSDARGTAASRKPGVVFLGTHHAREHLSTEVALLLPRKILESRSDPKVAALLKSRDLYFVPLVNPDGVEYDIEGGRYHMHRKNMRDNGDGSFGVDLNRNYAWGWGGGGASGDPEDDTYRGPSAFSEPESRAVRDFVSARPNLKVLVSYHTFSELILYPWGGSDAEIADKDALRAFRAMAQEMAAMTGYRPMQSSDLYVATGDTCDWAWGEKGIFAFTFELTPKSMWDGGFYPGAAAVAKTVQANVAPALYMIDLADDPRRAGRAPAVAAVPAAGENTR
jgi:carboxypeptidase T